MRTKLCLLITILWLSPFTHSLLGQNSPFQIEQLNPQGLALHLTDVKVFNNQSALINTYSKHLFKYNLLNDSTWSQSRYTKILCKPCEPSGRMQVLNERVFRKGNYFTKDAGVTWQEITPPNKWFPTIKNFHFVDSSRWVYQTPQDSLFISLDRGTTWKKENTLYAWLGADESQVLLWRDSDSSVFKLNEDSLFLLFDFNERTLINKKPPYLHQVDSAHFVFEVDYKMYTYNAFIDSLWEVSQLSLYRPAARIYNEGDAFIREDNLGDLSFFLDTNMNWVSRNRPFNSASFAYSDRRLFFMSYQANVTFNFGNMGVLRIGNNSSELWGSSYNGITQKIKRRNNDTLFYAIPDKYVNARGEIMGTHGNLYFPERTIDSTLWLSQSDELSSSDYGDTWKNRDLSTLVLPPANGSPWHIDFTRAEDTSCYVDFWYRYNDSNVIGYYNGQTTLFQFAPSNFLGRRGNLFFKNCDTGLVFYDSLLIAFDRLNNTHKTALVGFFPQQIKKHGNYYYVASRSLGLYRSSNLMNWSAFRTNYPYIPEIILGDTLFLNINSEQNYLFYSSDSGISIDSIFIPADIEFMDIANQNTLILSGFGGTVWHIHLNPNEGGLSLSPELRNESISTIHIYPNPVEAGYELHWEVFKGDKKVKSVELLDSRGTLILKQHSANIDALKLPAHLPKGIYFIVLEIGLNYSWHRIVLH